MERRLGRGLRSLLTDTEPPESQREIEVARIRPNPYQPRRNFSAGALEELRDSIRSHGVLQPVVLRPCESGFELVAGERRWRAARLAGLRTIPAVVREGVDDATMLELALVENVQRRDLDPLEKARGYRSMMERLELTQEDVARKVGLQRSTVANHLRLLELPEEVQAAVGEGLLSMGHARALLGLSNPARQVALMKIAVRRELSVREVERRVRQSRAPEGEGGAGKAPGSTRTAAPPWAEGLERRLRESLGTKVRLVPGPGEGGRIVLEYYRRDELERLMERLAPARTL